jgi:hypothetical protein
VNVGKKRSSFCNQKTFVIRKHSGQSTRGEDAARKLQEKHPPRLRAIPQRLRGKAAEWAADLVLDETVVARAIRTNQKPFWTVILLFDRVS